MILCYRLLLTITTFSLLTCTSYYWANLSMVILFYGFVCRICDAHVDRRSESRLRGNIRKSSHSVQRKSGQLYFKICNCRRDLASGFTTFDPESKAQSMAWKYVTSPPPRKFRVFASVLATGILKELYGLTIWNMAELLQEHTMFI